MSKNIFVWLLGIFLLTTASTARAQQPKILQVGVLTLGSPQLPQIEGLRAGLKEAGYVEKKTLVLDIAAKETYEELRPIAKAYVEKKLDVIVALGSTAPLLAKALTETIPIVFVGASDPIASGLVKSLARPEANVTGVARATDLEMQGKRLEIFKDAVPSSRRVAVLFNARGENPLHAESLKLLHKVAPALGLKLIEKPVKSPADIDRTLSTISKDSTDGLFIICASIFRDSLKKLADFALGKRLPLSTCGARHVSDDGALLNYGADDYRLGLRGAWYVDRILKGAKPAELPVEQPTKFEFVINLKTAKQIGLTIPPNVLARADRVIR